MKRGKSRKVKAFAPSISPKKSGAGRQSVNLSEYMTPVQLERTRHDVSMWRRSIAEAEAAYWPHRVRMQRMYVDTILNGHLFSVMEIRKELTTLRRFEVIDAKSEEPSRDLTQALSSQLWLDDFMSYTMDALGFGYSLINLGDVVGGQLKDVGITKRWHVSPDRREVGKYIYATTGKSFDESPYVDWNIYVKTRSEHGISPCGMGLFYQAALYEIFLRNTLGYNGDFVELYAMPYRIGKTNKVEQHELDEFEESLRKMGSAGYAMIDPLDDIQFLESAIAGTGYQAYESLEKRCEATVSKILLGHADAADSVPGKLGNDAAESPAQAALIRKQSRDGKFMEALINSELAPRLRAIGINDLIPEGYLFRFSNDKERREKREQEDKDNKATADYVQTFSNAGYTIPAEYIQERTGIPIEVKEVAPPVDEEEEDQDAEPGEENEEEGDQEKEKAPPLSPKKSEKDPAKRIKNALNKLYK